MNRSEVKENRIKWGTYLMTPGLKKAKGWLEVTEEYALANYGTAAAAGLCCLGHGCQLFNISSTILHSDKSKVVYGENGEEYAAPKELVELVGLWDNEGGSRDRNTVIGSFGGLLRQYPSLAHANDDNDFDITPSMIGTYILTMIEGGQNTPFKPLEYYSV
jgi:hypothetical protein